MKENILISYYTRKTMFEMGQMTEFDLPGELKAGGGMNSKCWNMMRAIDIQVVDQIEDIEHLVVLIDPLQISSLGSDKAAIIAEIKALKALKILFAEEQELLRWNGHLLKLIIDAVDVVAVSNRYLQNILLEFGVSSEILYTPIDSDFYSPGDAVNPRLVAMGQVSIVKNTRAIIELFRSMPEEIECVFIGNSALWGEVKNPVDKTIESELSDVCTWYSSLSRTEVAEVLSTAWGYVSMSKYDVGSLSFLEAGMSACHCFAWDVHLQFDEYVNVMRFDGNHGRTLDVKFGVDTILESFEKTGDSLDLAIRDELMHKHSFSVFKNKLVDLVGRGYVL